MPATTTNHSLPYPEDGDPADVPADVKALAEKVDSELDVIAPAQLTRQTAGHLLIANSSGVVTGVAMGGDGTISDDGDFQIARGAVGTTELADKGVTTGKLNDGAVTNGKVTDGAITSRKAALTAGVVRSLGTFGLTGSYADLTDTLTITPDVASTLLVVAVFDFEVESNGGSEAIANGSLKLDSDAEQTRVAVVESPLTDGDKVRVTAMQVYALPLTAARHTIILRGKLNSGRSGSNGANTAFTHTLIAA